MTSSYPKSRLHRHFYRNGPSHRDGADVTFGDIVKIFAFRTVNIGRWVTAHEQQIAANLFFDALCDLMSILCVPERVISLNGTLSLAFGKGGQKFSSAHYNAATRTLALAKNAGGGALAHEWFHAFDHFISTRFFTSASHHDFASALWLKNAQVKEHPLNQRLEACYQHIFLQPDSDQPSDLFVRSSAADRAMGTFYYAQPQEVCARAFEAFIQDQPLKNAFLVQGTKQSAEAQVGIYPEDAHRKRIGHYFMRYFSLLGTALERQDG
ncbi:CLCA_X family protein [Aestuariibacter salexigens]|uniref:CLCA_X family protein n=1 Tax=Aestuariibacter salexigens TaxID=226010 RepID=UPI000412E21C|nr:CLCA_X family protein [Aestuariibacter salexigens]